DSLSRKNGTSYYISYYLPSWDGKHLAVEFNDYSGLTGLLLLLDAKTGKILHEPFTNSYPSGFGGVSWLPDSSGLLYMRFPVTDNKVKGYKQNAESYLYMLGNEGFGFPVFSSKLANADDPKAYPIVIATSSHEKYPIGFMMTSDDYWDAYISDWEALKTGRANWKPLYKRSDKVLSSNFKQVDETFYFISGKSNSFNLSKVDLDSSIWEPKLIVNAPEGETISDFTVNFNGLYLSTLKNGVKAKLYHLKNKGKIQELKMPQESGEIDLEILSPKKDILWAYTAGWISDLKRYRLEADGSFVPDNYGAKDMYTEFGDLQVTETEYVSSDGVKVPISIIHNPDYKGKRPTIMVTYGAFGEKLSPGFSPLYLPWVAHGGTLVYPHIRGGGEKGVDWYEAGKKSTKRNSWMDIIAAAEFLIEEDYTSAEGIVLMSPSGGGVAGGMAINEAPELFKGFIGEMPILNPSRLEFGNFSNNYHLEFGSAKDSAEVEYLYAMDPLLNLNLEEKLPNALIISAGNDDRVDGFQMFKYIATLQKFDAAESAYLYNDPDAAHSEISDIYNVYGMVFGFAEHITE
ncbi:MAG: prolyl oligopeptidase family serine peptidase, partial [Pricia sp.]